MKYRVVIEQGARDDLESILLWLGEQSERVARSWYVRVKAAVQSLDHSPLRCPLAPENDYFPEEIRHLLHGRRRYVYRILFTIRDKTVHVLHVRHGFENPKPSSAPI